MTYYESTENQTVGLKTNPFNVVFLSSQKKDDPK